MLFPEHFLAVRATVDPQREEEFNRWYNSEHIPDVVNTFPGCLGCISVQGHGRRRVTSVHGAVCV
jgi:hypothetical protein